MNSEPNASPGNLHTPPNVVEGNPLPGHLTGPGSMPGSAPPRPSPKTGKGRKGAGDGLTGSGDDGSAGMFGPPV